ncbi:MAG TPA: efflux RND transporter periplasmic adaptor subunit [Gemmataceae bacterium]|nr:efflux RND transporter periplasmic adaptor subunit [Gemmataceae bacterium]
MPNKRTDASRGVFLLPLVFLLGCGPSPYASPHTSEEKSLPSLRVVSPERTAIHCEVSQPGTIEAFEETRMFAKVSGYVRKWYVDIGHRVRTGQVLADLWVPELEEELKQKEALVEQAEAQLAQAREAEKAAEAAHKSAAAQVEVAEANRQILLARQKRTQMQYQRLQRVGANVLDREQVEEAQLGYETAKAGVLESEARIKAAEALREETKARWSKAVSDVHAAEAARTVAEKNRDYVKAQVGYMHLTAPYNGMVTHRAVNTGDFVQTAEAGKDQPLYVVRRTDLLRMFVQVPESDVYWVQKGTAARIRVPALRGQTLTGAVARTSWSADPETRTLRAEIDMPNTEGRLRPGMYVSATLSTELPDVLSLPRSAVATEGEVTRGYQSYCYQVEDGKAHRLRIELGAGDSERVEVLKKQTRRGGPWVPVTGSEQIVGGNLSEVHDGQAVTIQSAE